jgi:O-succinylbenzoic acid--CoA ligase
MNLFPSHITINGQVISIDELQKKEVTDEWEKEFLNFIKEWYNTDDFILVKTSGSTGTPKTISLKKEFVAASAMRTINFFGLKKNDTVLHCLPCRYIAGKLMIIRALLAELDLYLVNPSINFEDIKNTSFKFAAMVVNQVQKYVDFGNWNIEKLLIGGSAIPQLLTNKLQDISTQCFSSYAMTETATHIALQKLNGTNKSEYYSCFNDIDVTLSENNCICIEMPGLENGKLQTNDFGELLNLRTFRVLGRADNVIVSGGIKFSPEEIEKKLEAFISEPFAISSLPDNRLGEIIVLVIERDKNILSEKTYDKIYNEQLSQYEQPKKIIFINELPKTENGKINRPKLKLRLLEK